MLGLGGCDGVLTREGLCATFHAFVWILLSLCNENIEVCSPTAQGHTQAPFWSGDTGIGFRTIIRQGICPLNGFSYYLQQPAEVARSTGGSRRRPWPGNP